MLRYYSPMFTDHPTKIAFQTPVHTSWDTWHMSVVRIYLIYVCIMMQVTAIRLFTEWRREKNPIIFIKKIRYKVKNINRKSTNKSNNKRLSYQLYRLLSLRLCCLLRQLAVWQHLEFIPLFDNQVMSFILF